MHKNIHINILKQRERIVIKEVKKKLTDQQAMLKVQTLKNISLSFLLQKLAACVALYVPCNTSTVVVDIETHESQVCILKYYIKNVVK